MPDEVDGAVATGVCSPRRAAVVRDGRRSRHAEARHGRRATLRVGGAEPQDRGARREDEKVVAGRHGVGQEGGAEREVRVRVVRREGACRVREGRHGGAGGHGDTRIGRRVERRSEYCRIVGRRREEGQVDCGERVGAGAALRVSLGPVDDNAAQRFVGDLAIRLCVGVAVEPSGVVKDGLIRKARRRLRGRARLRGRE